MPSFSVVMPCHNAADTVAHAIASVQAQTCTDWEMICVDDGSTDATRAILRALAAENPRLRVVTQLNAGPSRARNAGAALAEGRYIAFLDADDVWLPGKLASAGRLFAAAPDADAVFGRVIFFDGQSGRETARSAAHEGALALADCLGENPLCTLSNLTVRAECFRDTGGFDEGLRHSEDLAWLVSAVVGGARIDGTSEEHIRYRASLGGLSSDLAAMHVGWRRAVTSAVAGLPAATLRRAEACHLRYLARRALRIGQPPATARSLALRGLRLSPRAFLGDLRRGPVLLAACLAAPFLSTALRRRAFA